MRLKGLKGSRMLPLVVVALLCVGTVSGAWISGFFVSGSIVGTNAEQPDIVTFAFGEVDIDSGVVVVGGNYTNLDGSVDVAMSYNGEINSSSSACNFQSGVDFTVAVSINGAANEYLLDNTGTHTVTQTLNPGKNPVVLTFTPSSFPCPIYGNWEVIGELV